MRKRTFLTLTANYLDSKAVIEALSMFAYFGAVPALIQQVVAMMLTDTDWIDQTYLPLCRKRMRVREIKNRKQDINK